VKGIPPTHITQDDTPTLDEEYTALWFDKVLTPEEQGLMLRGYQDQFDAEEVVAG